MNDDDDIKQVIVLRKDLNMRKGKMVAQGAHASMAVFLNRGQIATKYGCERFSVCLNDAAKAWLTGSFTKVCLGVDSKDELLTIHDKAMLAGLPCSLITDAGRTEFNGVPTHTAVAIGPATSKEIDKITGNLKLL
jgi:PTH2 family peptidyl-tRNA hydrolase